MQISMKYFVTKIVFNKNPVDNIIGPYVSDKQQLAINIPI